MTPSDFLRAHAPGRRDSDPCAPEVLAKLFPATPPRRRSSRNAIDRLASELEQPPRVAVIHESGKLTLTLGCGQGAIVLNERNAESLLRVCWFARDGRRVLIQGESGVGKEFAARLVHERSRPHGPFVDLNCAAIPETLVESELFGALRGAYSECSANRDGYFVAANGGTLFLDEIGELPLNVQAKLLRVIETGAVTPLGGTRAKVVDVQVVSATSRRLADDVDNGLFRNDLFRRLAQGVVTIPPLRERTDEIVPIAVAVLTKLSSALSVRLSPEAAVALKAHDWPGNIRELENKVMSAVSVARNASRVADGTDTVLIALEDLEAAE